MPNPELPLGIDPGYLPVWDEFNRMKAVAQLRDIVDEDCIGECFRLLVAQTGVRVKAKLHTQDFVDFRAGMQRISKWYRKYGLHRNLKVRKHESKITYVESPIVCAVLNPVLTGTVTFRCTPFGIKYVLDSMDNRAWKVRPLQLSQLDYLGRPRKFLPLSKLKPKDFYCVFEDNGVELGLSRLESELILQYKISPTKALPQYPSLERDLKRLKRAAITGVF